MRTALAVAALVGLGACKKPPPPVRPTPVPTADDHAIVPGQRIGPISLGMTDADVVAALGPPAEEKLGPDLRGTWGPLTIGFHRKNWVISISTSDPVDVTPEGLHVGSTLAEVRSRLGEPVKVSAHPLRDPTTGAVVQDYARHCYPGGVMYDFAASSTNVSQIEIGTGCTD